MGKSKRVQKPGRKHKDKGRSIVPQRLVQSVVLEARTPRTPLFALGLTHVKKRPLILLGAHKELCPSTCACVFCEAKARRSSDTSRKPMFTLHSNYIRKRPLFTLHLGEARADELLLPLVNHADRTVSAEESAGPVQTVMTADRATFFDGRLNENSRVRWIDNQSHVYLGGDSANGFTPSEVLAEAAAFKSVQGQNHLHPHHPFVNRPIVEGRIPTPITRPRRDSVLAAITQAFSIRGQQKINNAPLHTALSVNSCYQAMAGYACLPGVDSAVVIPYPRSVKNANFPGYIVGVYSSLLAVTVTVPYIHPGELTPQQIITICVY
jgi:hypothetical protein